MPKKKNLPRSYQKRARAEQEELTKLKITEAVAELHRTVGPARTTVSEIAELAGVGRVTVYKHFPTDGELFRACGDHWLSQNPPPDLAASLAIEEFSKRCLSVLRLLYPYYRKTYDMMGKVLRDAQLMPSLAEVVEEGWINMIRELEAAMMEKTQSATETKKLRASIRVALDINTWKTLTDAGLTDAQAVELVCEWL